MTFGILVLSGNKKTLQVKFTNAKGKDVQMPIPLAELSESLTKLGKPKIDLLNNLEVELDEVGGQPKKVREKGKNWEQPSSSNPNNTSRSSSTTRSRTSQNNRIERSSAQQAIPGNTSSNCFHNPYNFIPAPPRQTNDQHLGDHKPAGHGIYHLDRWSGQIVVTLTTKTPLLIPDSAKATEDNNNHKTFPVRIGADGKPYLPPTSVKGVLRNAYEAITNSRLSIFEKHEDRLALRMPANTGLEMVPARIENGKIVLYTGTSGVGNDGKPKRQDAMYAAWLPRYQFRGTEVANHAVKYTNNSLPQHGEKVTAWLEEYEKKGRNDTQMFKYWRVRKIVPFGQKLGPEPNPSQSNGSHRPTGVGMKKVTGYVCITNKNIDRKHDERVFFSTDEPISVELTPDLKKQWTELITNYQEIHADEIQKGRHSPPALQHSKWSRHVQGGNKERTLSEGTLCYAHTKKEGTQYRVIGLYPVMITRGLHKVSPDELLDYTLKPATCMEELSPADRVFGWVNQNGQGAYKGNLRISGITCTSDNPIEHFGNQGFPLAILGQPQPQQARFYQAEDKNGQPLDKGLDKKKIYADKKQGLRGRKVYPHHRALPTTHWDNPTEDRTNTANNRQYQEYHRCENTRDDQNRSILGWVKSEVTFSFKIDVTNLSSVELGALLWLLSLPKDHYHRLGGAKPFGFGSVHLEIDWKNTDLRKGEGWNEYYSSLLPLPIPDAQSAELCVSEFKQAISAVYGSNFEQVSFIGAFCRCAQGFNDQLPIHYPRTSPAPNPQGEGFDWFVENEREHHQKVSLPSLISDRGLPLNP